MSCLFSARYIFASNIAVGAYISKLALGASIIEAVMAVRCVCSREECDRQKVLVCTRSELGEFPPDLSGAGTESERMIKPRVQNHSGTHSE